MDRHAWIIVVVVAWMPVWLITGLYLFDRTHLWAFLAIAGAPMLLAALGMAIFLATELTVSQFVASLGFVAACSAEALGTALTFQIIGCAVFIRLLGLALQRIWWPRF